MRIYENFKEMYSEVQRDVVELGTRTSSESVQNIQGVGEDYDMKEIIGYSYELVDVETYPSSFSNREIQWLVKELAERVDLRHINPGEAWKIRSEIWETFLNTEGKFDYTYNERMRRQLGTLIGELKKRPNTRQAVMTIYSPGKDMVYLGGYKRIPCSLSYQFLLRKELLYMVYNMRSCDVMTHFRFDAALACMLLIHVAVKIHAETGSLIHNMGSLHIFKKDMAGIF